MLKSLLTLATLSLLFATGCGGTNSQSVCTPTGFAMDVRPVDPTAAAPDHTLTAPGNQEKFEAGLGPTIGPEPCIFHPLYQLVNAQWTTSDPSNVSISSANDATNGVATCLGATQPGTTVSATLTNSGFTETVSVPITCK